jgi:hypothetical protein
MAIEKIDIPKLPDVDTNMSIGYNLLILQKVINILRGFSTELVDKIYDIENSSQADTIALQVANELMEHKLRVVIPYDITVGAMFMHQHNNVVYRIDYTTSFEVQITNVTNPEWDVNHLMIQIKGGDGSVVYPTIICQDHIVKIYFGDTIEQTYSIYII